MQRRAILVFGAIAVLALALPALASATWTHKGKGELKENASITLSGELTLNTAKGNVTCPTSIGATLTGKSSSGTVNSYTVSEPSKCSLSGSLKTVCGTHGATKVEKTGSWELTNEETKIKISSIDLTFQFGKCLIPSLRIKGTATATPNNAFAMSTLTLSGSQTLYNALEEEAGSANLSGTPSVSPAATYGLKVALVKTAWLMENKHLSEDGEMTLNGEFAFSYSGGLVSCTASAVLALTSSEVEAEGSEGEGEVESFAISEPSKCVAGGELKTLCGEHPVKSVAKTGTWILNANEEDISVSGLTLDYEFNECATTSLRLEGSATLSVEEPTAITAATFSGKPAIYNSGGEKVGTAELAGGQSAAPSETFQLRELRKVPTTPTSLDPPAEFPTAFTVSGGGSVLKGGETSTSCTSLTGSGEINAAKTGTVTLTFKGCKSGGTTCTSAGQAAGTVVTPTLPIDLTTEEYTEGKITPAMLFTTSSGEFASYKCAFGLVSIKVTGNGVIGGITTPGYNESSSTILLHFGVEGSEQEFTEANIEEVIAEYRLEQVINEAEPQPATLETEITLSFTEGKVELTEE